MSRTSELLPDPDTPVMQMNVPSGKSTLISLRLLWRAPRSDSHADAGGGVLGGSIARRLRRGARWEQSACDDGDCRHANETGESGSHRLAPLTPLMHCRDCRLTQLCIDFLEIVAANEHLSRFPAGRW